MSEDEKSPAPPALQRRPWSKPTIIEGSLARGVKGPRPPFLDGSGADSRSNTALSPVHS
jgi:hypothetical protein